MERLFLRGEVYAIGVLAGLSDVEYGYVTPSGQRRTVIKEHEFYKDYRLSSPDTVLKTKLGVCWDTAEYLRHRCTQYPCTTLYFELKPGNSHTVAIFHVSKEMLFIVEHSYAKYRGVYGPYKSHQEIANLVLEHMRAEPDVKDLTLAFATVYTTPTFGITCQEMMDHCRAGEVISSVK